MTYEQRTSLSDELCAWAMQSKLETSEMNGEQLKLFGMDLVSQHTPEDFKSRVYGAVSLLASKGVRFTAEDVREISGDPPNHPNAFGAAFSSALKRYHCRHVGIIKATRMSAHSRLLPVYQR